MRVFAGRAGIHVSPSKLGSSAVTCIHNGGQVHTSVSPALVVEFFKQHSLP